jgi:hypothetical protein
VLRIEPSGARSQRARGESARQALDRYVDMVSRTRPATDADGKKWTPVPTTASLDAITWVGLSAGGVPATAIDEAERALGLALPVGYRSYVARFGEAVDTLMLRVHPPTRVVAELAGRRTQLDAYWFWAPASDGFGADEAYRSIMLADTLQGDQLLFFPERPDRFYVLPRHARSIAMLRGTFEQACAWIVEGGELGGAASVRWAQPLEGLLRETWQSDGDEDDDGEGEDTVGQVVADVLAETDRRGRAIRSEDDDGGWTILLPAIGGTAFVFAGGTQVSIERDPRAPAHALARVVSALEELDLERADADAD